MQVLPRTLSCESSLVQAFYTYASRVDQLHRISEHRRRSDLPLLGWPEELSEIDRLGQMVASLDRLSPTPAEVCYVMEEIRKYVASRGTFEDHCRLVWRRAYPGGDPGLNEFEQAVFRRLAHVGRLARRNEKIFRMVAGFTEYAAAGWFPFFITLTVRNSDLDRVFAPEARCWSRFIESFGRVLVANSQTAPHAALNGSQRISDFVQFSRAAEKSPRLERPHLHAVIWLRYLPPGLRDPNRGRRVPDQVNTIWFKRFWPWCDRQAYSAIPIRFGPNDVFARAGWQWPVDRLPDNRYVARECGSPLRLARYMAKYLTKDPSAPRTDRRIMRWQMSNGFGLTEIDSLVRSLPLPLVESVLCRLKATEWTHLNHPVPMPLVRRRAAKRVMRERIAPITSTAPSEATAAMSYLLATMATPTQPGLLSSLDEMRKQAASTTTIPDGVNTTFSPTRNLRPSAAFSQEDLDRVNAAAGRIFTDGAYQRSVRGNAHPLE